MGSNTVSAAILNYRNQAIDAHYPKQLPFDRTEFTCSITYFSCFGIEVQEIHSVKSICKPWFPNLIASTNKAIHLQSFQIFNSQRTKARKISYGASKAAPVFSNLEKEYFREKLLQFEAVSVREESLATALPHGKNWLRRTRRYGNRLKTLRGRNPPLASRSFVLFGKN